MATTKSTKRAAGFRVPGMSEADAVKVRNQFMAPGDIDQPAGVGILKTAHNPAGAQKFASYLVGTSAQEYFATETDEYPLIAGVAANDGMPPLSELNPPAVDLSELDDLEATQEMLVKTGLLTN